MTLLQNLSATSNADLIGNDANPTFKIVNTSTGSALNLLAANAVGLSVTASGATAAITATARNTGNAIIAIGDSGATDAALGAALVAKFSANVAGATVAPLSVVASTASQAVLSISGVFISTASINVTQAQSAFVIPVYHETQKVWGFLSASKGVA